METPRPKAKKGRLLVRILAVLTGLFTVFLLGVWWHIANDNPEVVVPTPVMPGPNAFDFYVAAGKGIVNTKQIDNATVNRPKTPVTLAQKEALLQQNASVFLSVQKGFAYPYYNPPIRSFSTLIPYFSQEIRLGRLIRLQSEVRAAHGDWVGAADSALDAIRLGEDIPRGGIYIAQSVGCTCAGSGHIALWPTIDHLDAGQARQATRRLEEIMGRHFAWPETLQEEKWMGQAGLKEVLRGVNARNALSSVEGTIGTGMNADTFQRFRAAFYMAYGKKRILQNYTTLMDMQIAQARQPFGTKAPALPKLDPITDAMIPVFDEGRFKECESEAQNGLLLLALALRAYRLEQGHYPTALAELVPAYLTKLPNDPFAAQGTFRYRIDGEKYLLYSVGPDTKDDGGRTIDDPKLATQDNPRRRYYVQTGSQGDVVAGSNFP